MAPPMTALDSQRRAAGEPGVVGVAAVAAGRWGRAVGRRGVCVRRGGVRGMRQDSGVCGQARRAVRSWRALSPA